jgi:hypothetical protein
VGGGESGAAAVAGCGYLGSWRRGQSWWCRLAMRVGGGLAEGGWRWRWGRRIGGGATR